MIDQQLLADIDRAKRNHSFGVKKFGFNKNSQQYGQHEPVTGNSLPSVSSTLPTAVEMHRKQQNDIKILQDILRERDNEIKTLSIQTQQPQNSYYQPPVHFSPSQTVPQAQTPSPSRNASMMQNQIQNQSSPAAVRYQQTPEMHPAQSQMNYYGQNTQLASPYQTGAPTPSPKSVQPPSRYTPVPRRTPMAPNESPEPSRYPRGRSDTPPRLQTPAQAQTMQPSPSQILEQERLNKQQWDSIRKQGMQNELISTLNNQTFQHEMHKQHQQTESERKYLERMEHLRQLRDEEQSQRQAKLLAQRKYQEDLNRQSQIRRNISHSYDQIEEKNYSKGVESLIGMQPQSYVPSNHMYMYGPAGATGENATPVRLAKSLRKTLSFNPIVGTLHDTSVYHKPNPPTYYKSSFNAGVSKNMLGYDPEFSTSPAMQQPKYTKANPYVYQSNPLGRPQAGPNIFMSQNWQKTSYNKAFGDQPHNGYPLG